jgi:hypothetical protein
MPSVGKYAEKLTGTTLSAYQTALAWRSPAPFRIHHCLPNINGLSYPSGDNFPARVEGDVSAFPEFRALMVGFLEKHTPAGDAGDIVSAVKNGTEGPAGAADRVRPAVTTSGRTP